MLNQLGIPFIVTSVVILLLILAYTFKGGVKTIVWTDTLQTTFVGLIACVIYVLQHLDLSFTQAWAQMDALDYDKFLFTDIGLLRTILNTYWEEHLLRLP